VRCPVVSHTTTSRSPTGWRHDTCDGVGTGKPEETDAMFVLWRDRPLEGRPGVSRETPCVNPEESSVIRREEKKADFGKMLVLFITIGQILVTGLSTHSNLDRQESEFPDHPTKNYLQFASETCLHGFVQGAEHGTGQLRADRDYYAMSHLFLFQETSKRQRSDGRHKQDLKATRQYQFSCRAVYGSKFQRAAAAVGRWGTAVRSPGRTMANAVQASPPTRQTNHSWTQRTDTTQQHQNLSLSPRRAMTGARRSLSLNPNVAVPGQHEMAVWVWHTTSEAEGSRQAFSGPWPRHSAEPGEDDAKIQGDDLGQKQRRKRDAEAAVDGRQIPSHPHAGIPRCDACGSSPYKCKCCYENGTPVPTGCRTTCDLTTGHVSYEPNCTLCSRGWWNTAVCSRIGRRTTLRRTPCAWCVSDAGHKSNAPTAGNGHAQDAYREALACAGTATSISARSAGRHTMTITVPVVSGQNWNRSGAPSKVRGYHEKSEGSGRKKGSQCLTIGTRTRRRMCSTGRTLTWRKPPP